MYLRDLDVGKFEKWLSERGAEVLATTNPYEVVRFKANDRVSIIYRDKADRLNFQNGAFEACDAFKNRTSWSSGNKGTRPNNKKPVLKRTVFERDGDECFYCGLPMPEDDMTLEHLVAIVDGGTNHPSNLALAHDACNKLAESMAVVQKVKVRESMREMNRPKDIPPHPPGTTIDDLVDESRIGNVRP